MNKIRGWYFAEESRKLRYGDDRPIVIGQTHTVEGKPELCECGLHFSVNILDALKYAPGPILYYVEGSGGMDMGVDKISAQSRTYLAGFDASEMLLEFARKVALISIEKIKPYTNKYDLIVEYLGTGNVDLVSAAESAAWAARSAVRSAARSAAWSAAESAAWAARSAVESSARSSVRSAAWSAAWSSVRSAARSAVRSSARSSARASESAARSVQSRILIELVYKYYLSIEEVI